MGPARIYPWRKMRRSRVPSIAPGTFFVAQSWADCITNMAGFNLRQAQVFTLGQIYRDFSGKKPRYSKRKGPLAGPRSGRTPSGHSPENWEFFAKFIK